MILAGVLLPAMVAVALVIVAAVFAYELRKPEIHQWVWAMAYRCKDRLRKAWRYFDSEAGK